MKIIYIIVYGLTEFQFGDFQSCNEATVYADSIFCFVLMFAIGFSNYKALEAIFGVRSWESILPQNFFPKINVLNPPKADLKLF